MAISSKPADIRLEVGVDVDNSFEIFKKDIDELVKRVNTEPRKIKVQLDKKSFEEELKDVNSRIAGLRKNILDSFSAGTTSIDAAPIKKEAAEVVSVFDQIEDRIKAIGGGQDALLRMQNALSSIKPVLEEDKRLAAEFYTATNQVYSGRFFEQLAYSVGAYSDKILDASQLTQLFDDIVKAQVSTTIPAPIQVDDTQIKQLRTLQSVLKKASLEVEEFTTVKKNTSWGMSTARLLSVIEQNASDAQLKVLGLKRSFNSLNDVKGLLIGLATGTRGVSYNDGFGLDSFKTSTTQIRDAISSLKEMNQRVEQDNAALIELRDNLTNTFGNLPADPNGNGALLVTLEQLRQVCNEAPAAFQYIDEIERKLNMSLYENRGVTETPISQIKTEAEEAANSEGHLMTVTQELTETVSDGIGGNGFVPNLDDIQQAVNGIVDSIKTLNSELQKIKQVDTPSAGGAGKDSISLYQQISKSVRDYSQALTQAQKHVKDLRLSPDGLRWESDAHATEVDNLNRLRDLYEKYADAKIRAQMASSEQLKVAQLEIDLSNKLATSIERRVIAEDDIGGSRYKAEIALMEQAEREREEAIERSNEKLFQAHVEADRIRRLEYEQQVEKAYKESEINKSTEAAIRSERQKSYQERHVELMNEEAEVQRSNEKILQSHIGTSKRARQIYKDEIALMEQAEREREEAIERSNEKLFQAHVEASKRAKQLYKEEVAAFEQSEREREEVIERSNEKLFQAHVEASKRRRQQAESELTASWQSKGLTESNIKSLFGKAEKNKELFEDFDALKDRYKELIALQERWKKEGANPNDERVQAITRERKAIKELIEDRLLDVEAKKKSDANDIKRQALLKQVYTLLTRLEKEEANWTAARDGKSSGDYSKIQRYAEALRQLAVELTSADAPVKELDQRIRNLVTSAAESERVIRANGEAAQNWRDHISSLTNKFASWFSITRVIMAAVRAVRQLISSAKEIDAALTQLKIVTNATNAEMQEFANTAIDLSHNLGKSVVELTKSIETFSRLGYNLSDAAELAKYATIMSNVAGVSADEATTGMTSIIKGFNLEVSDAEHVADILVNVGQKYAVSAAEMMEAYEKSGAALHATNTTLEKSAGLIAAANASVQDASVIGVALKTVSARIRGKRICASVHSNMYAQELQVA